MALAEASTPVPAWTVHDRMRKAREEANITSHAAMAERLTVKLGVAIASSTVGAWERGTNQAGKKGLTMLDVHRAWAEICEVPVGWLVYGEGSRSRCCCPNPQVVNGVCAVCGGMMLRIAPTVTGQIDLPFVDPGSPRLASVKPS